MNAVSVIARQLPIRCELWRFSKASATPSPGIRLLVDGIQRLVPAYDGGDDLVGVCGPGEGLGVMVGLVEIAVDGGLEVDDGAEHAALQSALGERGEEGLDGVEPGARGRGEVEGEARVAGEPGQHLGLLVGGVVVENDVDDLAGRGRRLDGVEEADELLVPVALHAATEDGAVEDVEGGEQRGGAM